tara:strand:+ start:224 stop:508 length:285 start_codon:yes stop_codon:yes gene_type:complete
MDKNKEISKLEAKKEFLQKEIDALKKSTGQLQFEEFLRGKNHSSSFSDINGHSLDFGYFSVRLLSIKNSDYHKDLLIACEALERITEPTITEEK